MTASDRFGIRIRGTGSAVPDGVLTNADLEKLVDTSDEWIQQRTGIRERRIVDQKTEGTFTLSRDALVRALDDAGIEGSALDLVIVGTCTGEMGCPSVATRVAADIGATPAGAFDVVAACCGFVYALNTAEALIRSERYNRIGVVGCDALSTVTDYADRSLCILFGDAAASAILERDDDNPERGCLYQSLQADGSDWDLLYMPRRDQEIPDWDKDNPIRKGCLRMKGREVYKFAVKKFGEVIQDALDNAGIGVDDVAQFICHQSNARIIESAIERFNLPREKVHINIDRYGNTSAGSVGICLDEVWKAGGITPGDIVLIVAFGGGLTWASSVWRV